MLTLSSCNYHTLVNGTNNFNLVTPKLHTTDSVESENTVIAEMPYVLSFGRIRYLIPDSAAVSSRLIANSIVVEKVTDSTPNSITSNFDGSASANGTIKTTVMLPTRFPKAVVGYYIDWLNGNACKASLSSKMLAPSFELAHTLQDDKFSDWLIKQLFDNWRLLSPTFYLARMHTDIVDRVMMKLPYSLLPVNYKVNDDFIVKWTDNNLNTTVQLNFFEVYYLNVPDYRFTGKNTDTDTSKGSIALVSYKLFNGSLSRTATIRYVYNKQAKPPLSRIETTNGSSNRVKLTTVVFL